MKQMVIILSALLAVLLLASGFIVAANVELCENITITQREAAKLRAELTEKSGSLDQRTQENKAAAEALQKALKERDALSQQLNDAVLSSQEANDALSLQINENKQLLLQLEMLKKDYHELSQACQTLEVQIQELRSQTAAAAAASQQQAQADAQRIAELEVALEAAQSAAGNPSSAVHTAPPAF